MRQSSRCLFQSLRCPLKGTLTARKKRYLLRAEQMMQTGAVLIKTTEECGDPEDARAPERFCRGWEGRVQVRNGADRRRPGRTLLTGRAPRVVWVTPSPGPRHLLLPEPPVNPCPSHWESISGADQGQGRSRLLRMSRPWCPGRKSPCPPPTSDPPRPPLRSESPTTPRARPKGASRASPAEWSPFQPVCPRPQQPLPPASFCREESGPGGPVGTSHPRATQNPPSSCWDSDKLTEGGGRSTEHPLPERHPPQPEAALHRAPPLRTLPGLGGSVCGIRRPRTRASIWCWETSQGSKASGRCWAHPGRWNVL